MYNSREIDHRDQGRCEQVCESNNSTDINDCY